MRCYAPAILFALYALFYSADLHRGLASLLHVTPHAAFKAMTVAWLLGEAVAFYVYQRARRAGE